MEWHIEGTYDTLAFVENSTYAAELQRDTAEMQRKLGQTWVVRHYMIYLDSFFCFEFLAESWEAPPEALGTWS